MFHTSALSSPNPTHRYRKFTRLSAQSFYPPDFHLSESYSIHSDYSSILEGELKGMKIVDLFETLDSFQTPVTTQNLGQVYKCKLKKSGAPGNYC